MIVRGRTTLVVILGVIFLSGINAALHGRMTGWITDGIAPAALGLRKPLVAFQNLLGVFRGSVHLTRENGRLRNDLAVAHALAAQSDQERRDVAFYRAASGIRARLPYTAMTEANVVAVSDAGGVRQATVNRGTDDGIADGDIVISSEGTFVGIVRKTGSRHASVQLIGDPTLEIAGRILGTHITGLVRWSNGGLLLDLIRKDEVIHEGQIVVTSGDDQLPSALVIGTVRSVDMQAPTLFSLVRIIPVLDSATMIRVIILQQ